MWSIIWKRVKNSIWIDLLKSAHSSYENKICWVTFAKKAAYGCHAKKKKKKIMTVKNPFVDSKYKNDKLNTTKILEKSNTK